MPADSGMAFVVVLHLDPTRESQLAAVLSQHTDMPLEEIKDRMPIETNQDGKQRLFSVTVTPVKAPGDGDHRLISFAMQSEEAATAAPTSDRETGKNEQMLEDELRATRAELKSTTEQMESVNEELETSKEELQSFNEELHSVNSQLQHKVQELDEATNNIENLLSGTNIATLFLDTDLCIKWFSRASRTLLELVSTDIG